MKLEPDAREAEQANPDDKTLAYLTLDGTEGVLCEPCNRVLCHWCGQPRLCLCDEGGEIGQREFRALAAKHDGSPARRQRP